MDKLAATGLVVVVLLAGAAGPGVALQGGPPDHADDGGGPPDHAGQNGPPDHASDESDGDDGSPGDDARRDDEDGDDRATDGDDGGGVGSVVDDVTGDEDDESTATAPPSGTSTPSSPVEPILDIFDTPEDTPEESPEETEDATPTPESSRDSADPLPDPRETETPTPEPTDTPTETPDSTPESTPAADRDSDSDSRDTDRDDDDRSGSAARTETGGDETPTATETATEPTIEYETREDATRASVEDVRAGTVVEVPLRGPATDGEGVAVESVDVGVASGEPFALTVTRPTADGGDAPVPGVPVGYFEASTDHDAVENATLTVAVDEAALPDGVAPEDLTVLRYADGEWQPTETTYDEATGVYTAETGGFSKFAVAAPDDDPLRVTDLEVDEDGSGDGGTATVRATVENVADRQATGTVDITVDGETVETRELTLGGGETATVTYDLQAEQADGETVAVDGVEAGRLQLDATERRTAAGSINGNLAFGVGAAAFLVLSAVGTGLLAARRGEWDR